MFKELSKINYGLVWFFNPLVYAAYGQLIPSLHSIDDNIINA